MTSEQRDGRTFLQIALDFISRGWFVFPCKPAGKAPLTKHGYLDASNDEKQIREWWTKFPDANVAIACGASNLTVVDCDHGSATLEEAIAWIKRSDLPETYTVRTGKRQDRDGNPVCGLHLYYSGAMSGSGKFYFAGGSGDIQSNGDYVMAAGSIHPDSSEEYIVLRDFPLAPLPETVRSLKKPKREYTSGDTSISPEKLTDWREYLHEYITDHDLVFRDHEKVEPDGLWLGIACPFEHASGSLGTESSTVVGYFGKDIQFKCSHGTCEGAGRDTLYFRKEMFNREAEKHEQSIEETRPKDHESASGEPQHEIDDAGVIVKLDRRKLVYAPWEMEQMKMAPTQWLIDGLLPEVGTSLISAGPKTGKGTLTRQMAIAISEGKLFLDRKTKRGTVLYCSRQERLGELITLFRKANNGKMPDVMISPVEALQMGNQTPLDAIRQLVKEATRQNNGKRIRLVCLDMLTSWFKMSDSNQYSETFDVLEPLQSLAVELDLHICVIHHANKSATPEVLDVRSVMGSGAIAGSVDQVILLSNDPCTNRRVIATVQRTGDELRKHWLNWDPDTKTVTLGDQWNRSSSRASDANTERAIVEYIGDNPRCSRNKLFSSLGGDRARARKILDGLIEKGTVQQSPGGVGVSSYLFIAGESLF